jgi:hypothetical protein
LRGRRWAIGIGNPKHQISRQESAGLEPFRSCRRFCTNATLILNGDRNPLEVVTQFGRGNAQDIKTERPQFSIADSIVLQSIGAVVRRAVHFDNQMRLTTIEIDDIWTDGMLPAKLEAVLTPAKHRPERSFRWTCLASQIAPAVEMFKRTGRPIAVPAESPWARLGEHAVFGCDPEGCAASDRELHEIAAAWLANHSSDALREAIVGNDELAGSDRFNCDGNRNWRGGWR